MLYTRVPPGGASGGWSSQGSSEMKAVFEDLSDISKYDAKGADELEKCGQSLIKVKWRQPTHSK
jgi:hypothetical protein